MRRFFGSLGSGERKDESATTWESTATQEAWGKQKPPGTHHNVHKHAEREESALTPEESEPLLAFRKAGEAFKPEYPQRDS